MDRPRAQRALILPLLPDFSGRILIREVNWLGDAVMTTPALQRLREALPQAHFSLLTHQKLAPLWEEQKLIDEVLTFRPGDGLLGVARRLRRGRYALGLALPNSHRSALELWMAGIPSRVGLAAPLRSWLFTRPVPPHPARVPMHKRTPAEARQRCEANTAPDPRPPANAHQIHHYLHLAAALGAKSAALPPRLEVAPKTIAAVQARFHLSSRDPWLGLNAGAEYGPAKRWPAEGFAAAAVELQRQVQCRWVLFGGPADVETARHIETALIQAQPSPRTESLPLNLAGKTTLQELCAALTCCRALLTNDTGPMHVAAALGIPVVVPFGSTSPELTGPGLPGDPRHRLLRHPVPCSPCFLRTCPLDLRCLTGITVGQVVEAVRTSVLKDG